VIFRNRTRNQVLSDRTRIANTLVTRMVGLLSTKSLSDGEGLWIEPCNSIHTWFMRFTIDAVFLDDRGSVVKLKDRMKPWRMTLISPKARGVLELPAGTIERTGTRMGDVVERNA
jgi:uncharacterized membrane protein (UPF0127 family)